MSHQSDFGPDLVEVFGPSQQDGGPELIQLLTPEGERIDHPDYPLDLSADDIRNMYRDLVLVRTIDTAATAMASHSGGMAALRYSTTISVGVRVSADIAVKCRPAMARHIRFAPFINPRQLLRREKTCSESAPTTIPMASEADT